MAKAVRLPPWTPVVLSPEEAAALGAVGDGDAAWGVLVERPCLLCCGEGVRAGRPCSCRVGFFGCLAYFNRQSRRPRPVAPEGRPRADPGLRAGPEGLVKTATTREKTQNLLLVSGGPDLLARAGYDFDQAKELHPVERCTIWGCEACGVLQCPGGEALHYHEDGCPWCMEDPDVRAFHESGGVAQLRDRFKRASS